MKQTSRNTVRRSHKRARAATTSPPMSTNKKRAESFIRKLKWLDDLSAVIGKDHLTAHVAMIIQRERDKCASAWLATHSVKAKPNPKTKQPPLERWQIRVRAQKAERRALAKPLLKGVE
jgi:hypothetical protein